MHKTNDSKFFYPKSALSSKIIIGCGLKLAELHINLCVSLSHPAKIGCGLKHCNPLAILAMLTAVILYGIGTPYVRKYVTPLNLATEVSVFGQIGTAALTLLPIY
jgi:hypothetical protein